MKTESAAAWLISHLRRLQKQAAMLVRFEIWEQTTCEWKRSSNQGAAGLLVKGRRAAVNHIP